MLNTLDRRYEPQNGKYFSKTAVPRLYAAAREKVEVEIVTVKAY